MSRFTMRFGLLLGGLLLSACLPAVTPQVHPTPHVLVVQHTPVLSPLAEVFGLCAAELPQTELVRQETPANLLDVQQADLTLRWGLPTPPDSYSAILGEDTLVLIVHPQNPLNKLDAEQVRQIYSGKLTNWPDGIIEGLVEPWAYPQEQEIQQNFEQALDMKETLEQRKLYLAPGPGEMIEAVAQSPAAVGFIPRRWLTDKVRAIQITGLEPERLEFPILSLSPQEPEGAARAWLLCLQDQLR